MCSVRSCGSSSDRGSQYSRSAYRSGGCGGDAGRSRRLPIPREDEDEGRGVPQEDEVADVRVDGFDDIERIVEEQDRDEHDAQAVHQERSDRRGERDPETHDVAQARLPREIPDEEAVDRGDVEASAPDSEA